MIDQHKPLERQPGITRVSYFEIYWVTGLSRETREYRDRGYAYTRVHYQEKQSIFSISREELVSVSTRNPLGIVRHFCWIILFSMLSCDSSDRFVRTIATKGINHTHTRCQSKKGRRAQSHLKVQAIINTYMSSITYDSQQETHTMKFLAAWVMDAQKFNQLKGFIENQAANLNQKFTFVSQFRLVFSSFLFRNDDFYFSL